MRLKARPHPTPSLLSASLFLAVQRLPATCSQHLTHIPPCRVYRQGPSPSCISHLLSKICALPHRNSIERSLWCHQEEPGHKHLYLTATNMQTAPPVHLVFLVFPKYKRFFSYKTLIIFKMLIPFTQDI